MKNRLIPLASALALLAGLATGAHAKTTFVVLTPPANPGDNGPFTGSFSDTMTTAGAFTDDFIFTGPPPSSIDSFTAMVVAGVKFTGISLSYFNGPPIPLTTTATSTSINSSTVNPIISGTFDLQITGISAVGGKFTGTISAQPSPIPTPPIPEPSTVALLAMGLGGVGWMANRRRQKV